ncbi:MAG: chromate efflux transporter, partial [Synechococcales cyanobacterium]
LNGLLYGIKPALMAILVQAVWLFSQKALKDPSTRFAAVFAIVGYFLKWNEVLLLGLTGTGVMLGKNIHLRTPQMKTLILPLMGGTTSLPSVLGLFPFPHAVHWVDVFWIFLKIGSVLYGSGYVLLAFLQRELVEQRGWLTSQQMLDAVAIGQFTPGPVLTTATFIGYLLAGHPGAVAATTGIFLPAFILVWLVSPWVPKLRQSPWTSGFLDGLNAASLGLMVSVTITLSQSALVDFLTIGLAVISAIAILKFGINSAWLIIFGGLMGVGWGYLTNLL